MRQAKTIIREAEEMLASGDVDGAITLLRSEERKSTGSLRAARLGNASDRVFSIKLRAMTR